MLVFKSLKFGVVIKQNVRPAHISCFSASYSLSVSRKHCLSGWRNKCWSLGLNTVSSLSSKELRGGSYRHLNNGLFMITESTHVDLFDFFSAPPPSGHHSLCIQSMDGMLMFFEQDSYSFGRFLPGFLLPGPLIYNPRTDSFLTVSSARQLESYK